MTSSISLIPSEEIPSEETVTAVQTRIIPCNKCFNTSYIYSHYKCHRRYDITPQMENNDALITFPVKCSQCNANVTHLYIGSKSIQTSGCEVPGCNCTEVTTKIPVSDLYTFLSEIHEYH